MTMTLTNYACEDEDQDRDEDEYKDQDQYEPQNEVQDQAHIITINIYLILNRKSQTLQTQN